VQNNQPIVSICIPTYNGANFIDKCLQCAIDQTYPFIEIIINDDGSTDDTVSIIQHFQAIDKRIKFTQNSTNQGLVKNWNCCLTLAQGQYIKWLFQDDWMEPNAIEEFVKVAEQGYQLIVSKRHYILPLNASKEDEIYYYRNIKKLENYFDKAERGHYFSKLDIASLAVSNIALNFIGEPSLMFFKKSLIETVQNYDDNFHQICDLEHTLRIASHAGIYCINKPLCHFVIHTNSTSQSNLNNKYFQLRYFETAYYAYKILHHSLFFEFQNLITFRQKIKLKMYYKFRMYEAKQINKNEAELVTYQNLLYKFPFFKTSIIDKVVWYPLFFVIKLLKR
jgi:glycosyltransferase involved in cell wall biosynthesis